MGRLDELDLSQVAVPQAGGEARSTRAQERLAQLRLTLGGQLRSAARRSSGRRCCVLFEGWDASGKGGAIKRLVAPLDPRHVRVAPVRGADRRTRSATTSCGGSGPKLPGWGGMAVFDRSWYGRVLVERVEGFATREQWLRAYDEINHYERTLADEGDDPGQALATHLRRGAAEALRAAARRIR